MGVRAYRGVAILAVAVLVGVGVAFGAQAAGVHATKIVTGSMSPTVGRGDWIVVRDHDTDDRAAIGRGDIVVFRFPLGTTGRAVKRVVAVGGDTVAVERDAVTVNGRRIPVAGAPSNNAARARVDVVPAGHVFLLGDNARVSIDSRSLGAVPADEVVGRVLFVAHRGVVLVVVAMTVAIAVIASVGIAVRRRNRHPRVGMAR